MESFVFQHVKGGAAQIQTPAVKFGLGLLLLVNLATGCSGWWGSKQEGASPPSWLDHPPKNCVIGRSGPTYFLQDGIKNSKANALKQLAEAKGAKVEGTLEYLQTQSFTDAKDTMIVSIDTVITEAKLMEVWVSPGTNPSWGRKGSVHSLVCLTADQ